jgi:HSP20 family protein
MAYIRFYNPYYSANRDENTSEAYEQLIRSINAGNHCGCNKGNIPATNISETEKEYRIEMALPGVDKKDIVIKHENGYLNISVNKPAETENEENHNRYEFDYSGASRTFKTGDRVDVDKITAKYENGILIVGLPKKEAYVNKSSQSIVVE